MDSPGEAGAEPQTERSRGRLWLFGGAFAAVGALAIAPFFADASSLGRVPSEDETTAAVTAVRADFHEGDAVWVEPSWWLLPRHALEHMGSGTDAWPFAALMTSEDFDPVEAYGYKRLFVVSGFGREPTLPPEMDEADASETEVFRGDEVAVARWDLGAPLRLRTLTKEWQKLDVSRRFAEGEKPTPCRMKQDKHRCGRDGWMDVALEPRVVWRREVDWLFVHPGPPGSLLEVSWPGLARTTADGSPTWLYVRTGQTLESVRHPEGKDVNVELLVDGVEVDRAALDPHRFWMERRAIKLPAGDGKARVSFRIWSEDNAWRETVLEADLLSALPTPLRAWATNVVE